MNPVSPAGKMAIDIISFAYAATIAAGGVLGYVKAGSMPSLAMGVACGAVMGVGAYQTTNDPKNVSLSLATSALLTGVMGYRFISSGKFMPAGMVASLSLLMLMRYGYRLTQ
ncbi:transmembrane protein 14C-like isoform X2 [Haliotis rufescens]|uniref:transmembrane protein 14C-like isoform X2 n=1 Tax=Haliotis rufescens TaxID=6454 RepID=UPI00201F100D|nr:transmembrane protein 14C-like isoform X2 [Haliotis rufescens]